MALTLHCDASDTDKLFTTFQASGVHTGTPVEGSTVEVWDDEGDGVTDVAIMGDSTALSPLWRTTTPLMLHPCLDWNGTTTICRSYTQTGTAKPISTFITASACTIIIVFYAEAITTTNPVGLGECVLADYGANIHVTLRNAAGQRKVAFANQTGTLQTVELDLAEGTSVVLMARHDAGNLYLSLNGGTEAGPLASGNTSALTSELALGKVPGLPYFNGRIGELKIWNTGNADGNLAAEIAAMVSKWLVTATPKSASDTLTPVLTEASSLVKYPAVTARTESNVTTAGTSHTVTRPAAAVGNLVVILFGYVGTVTTIGWPGGYTPITSFKNQQTGRSWDAAYHLDTGGEGSSLTVTTTGTSTKSCHVGYSIGGASDPAVQAPEIGTTATGAAGTSADPPNVSGTGGSKSYLAIAAMIQAGEEADDDTWCTSAPSGYTNLLQKTTDTAGATTVNASLAAAERLVSAASENPGVFTTAQTLAWIAQTILIHPAVTATPKTASDTLRPIINEVSSVEAQGSASETLVPRITEASSLVSRSALTDTARPILGETASLMDRSATTETVRPVLSEVASLLVRLSVSESVRPVVTEAPAVLFQAEAMLVAETVRPVLIEARTLLSRTSTSETARPVLSEQVTLRVLGTSDTLRPVVSEATGLAARATPVESLVPGLSEQVSVRGLLSVTDLLQPRITPEDASLVVGGFISVSASDTLRPVVSEAPGSRLWHSLAVETLTPGLSEGRSLAARSTVTESLTPVVSELAALLRRSTQVDTLTPVISEQSSVFIPVVTIPQAAADTTRPLLGELVSLVVHLSTSDLLRPSLAEINVSAVRSSPSDLLGPILGEGLNLMGRTVALDTLTPSLTEALGSVVAIISLSAMDALVIRGTEAPAQLIVLAPPPIGLIRLGQVRLTPAGRTPQLTLKPAAKAAVEVRHAALSDPRTDG